MGDITHTEKERVREMSKAGVDYRIIRDKYLENEEFRKEYEKLGEREMAILIKESNEKAKVLFITNTQYNVLDGFLPLMDFEDGTSIRVVESEKSIYINTCGLDITIMSSQVDIELIKRKFNYIFVDMELNYGMDRYDGLRNMLEIVGTYRFLNCGIYVINSFEAHSMCKDLFNAFGGEVVFDYEDEEWEDYDYDEDYDDYGDWFSTDYEDEDYEEDEAPYKVERQED